jgi:hypothetical protein
MPSVPRRRFNQVLWALMPLEGIAALIALLRIPSEPGAAIFLGFSASRLVLAAIALFAVVATGVLAWGAVREPGWWRKVDALAGRFQARPRWMFGLFCGLFALFLGLAAFQLLSFSAAAKELVVLKSLQARMGLLVVWAELAILEFGLIVFLPDTPDRPRLKISLFQAGILAAIFTLIYWIAIKIFTTATWDLRMLRLQNYIYIPAATLLIWGGFEHYFHEKHWYARLNAALWVAAIVLFTYTLYRHSTEWVDWQNTPSKAYWQYLADAFLHGRLYLIKPESTHDLTLFNGQWYVPNPPLPGLVLVPFVAIWGVSAINTVQFSIVWGAINVGLVFMILQKASALELIPTRREGNVWITVLFALGSIHWWLAVLGRMWFMSQILTLLFALLATLAVLQRRSPWWVGVCLGLAVLSRPNVFTLWPFLAGLALYLQQREAGRLDWKRALAWAIPSGVPVALAGAALLVYNYARFRNFFDFGYVTINGADWILAAVQQYGMFNVHFFPINFNAMFLKLPVFSWADGCLRYKPGVEGISIFVTTPALIYIFRRMKWNLWTASAWVSIALSAGLLLLYSNTGAEQPGYRYIMDFIVPVLMLLSVGLGQGVSRWFKLLTGVSILSNAAALAWWFQKWVC